jgi:hypothetical protein
MPGLLNHYFQQTFITTDFTFQEGDRALVAVSTLHRACWVGTITFTAHPVPPWTSMGPDNRKQRTFGQKTRSTGRMGPMLFQGQQSFHAVSCQPSICSKKPAQENISQCIKNRSYHHNWLWPSNKQGLCWSLASAVSLGRPLDLMIWNRGKLKDNKNQTWLEYTISMFYWNIGPDILSDIIPDLWAVMICTSNLNA